MIRINLLGRPRPRIRRRVPVTGALQLALFLVPVVLAIAFLIGHNIMMQGQINNLKDKIGQKQAEADRLSAVEQDIEQIQKSRAEILGRIQVIETLKGNQAGPVTLLEAVGETVSLTATLWLTSMEQTGPNVIEFRGVAGSMNAVASFMTNLDRSGYFEDIEMKETRQQPRAEGTSNFEFMLSAKFSLPALPEAQAAAGGQR